MGVMRMISGAASRPRRRGQARSVQRIRCHVLGSSNFETVVLSAYSPEARTASIASRRRAAVASPQLRPIGREFLSLECSGFAQRGRPCHLTRPSSQNSRGRTPIPRSPLVLGARWRAAGALASDRPRRAMMVEREVGLPRRPAGRPLSLWQPHEEPQPRPYKPGEQIKIARPGQHDDGRCIEHRGFHDCNRCRALARASSALSCIGET
jgi:hypothetical protein